VAFNVEFAGGGVGGTFTATLQGETFTENPVNAIYTFILSPGIYTISGQILGPPDVPGPMGPISIGSGVLNINFYGVMTGGVASGAIQSSVTGVGAGQQPQQQVLPCSVDYITRTQPISNGAGGTFIPAGAMTFQLQFTVLAAATASNPVCQ
jgi:hypothetical protein